MGTGNFYFNFLPAASVGMRWLALIRFDVPSGENLARTTKHPRLTVKLVMWLNAKSACLPHSQVLSVLLKRHI